MSAATTTIEQVLTVRSELLGDLEVGEDQVYTFGHGLPGFPEGRRFALLPTGRDGVYWLQSVDFTALSFLLIDPFQFFPGHFQIDLTDEDVARLGTSDPARILVLAIITLGAALDQVATANLRAPILLNLGDHSAHQSIRAHEGYGVREAIDATALVGQSA